MSALSHSRLVILMFMSALIVAISLGIRQSFGIFLQPVVSELSITRETFGFAIALQNLIWGVAQPFAGMLADQFGSRKILIGGGVLYVAGLVIAANSSSAVELYLSLGMILGIALSCTTFAIVLGAVGRVVPVEKRSVILGIVSSGGSLGMFSVVPASQVFIAEYGWSFALLILAGFSVLVPLLSFFLNGDHDFIEFQEKNDGPISLLEAMQEARSHSGYWLLNAGFLVCGFHVAFIATHLPAFLNDRAVSPMVAALALALIGLFNILGTYLCGLCGGIYRKKYLLSYLYLGRAIVIAAFLVFPITDITIMMFAAAMGLLWLGTVPLTSGLVAEIFGTRYLSTLFGIVFFSHQAGSFLGAWSGGYFYDITGSYAAVWVMAVVLGIVAAVLHWPINDSPVNRIVKQAA